jgi:signal transduction histidine kinase
MARLRRIPIRLKLTLVFAGAMAVLLLGLGLFLYFHFESGLDQALDQQLRARASEVTALAPAAKLGERPLRERGETFAQFLALDGRSIDSSADITRPLLTAREIRAAARGPILLQRRERTRLYAVPIDHGQVITVAGVSLSEHEHALETLGAALLLGGPLALLVASVAGYLLAAAALIPVERMRQRAATISSGDIGARLPLPDSIDELHRLGSTLNEMLARLEQGLEHERAFVADASHELRSPLAVLKAELEVALLENGGERKLRAAVTSAVEETDRVIGLAEDLLVLARAEQGSLPLNSQPLRGAQLLSEVAGLHAPAAERAGRALLTRTDDGPSFTGDAAQLQRALSNLIDNALRYGRGPITVSARSGSGWVELHVTDEGPGFPPEFPAHAFERFTRGDPTRGRGGVGLGLAIVQAIAYAHHGQAHATNRPEGGADVSLTLPQGPRQS